MRRYFKWAVLCAALGLLLAGRASAGVIVTSDTSVTATTTGITGFQTFGDGMVGMQVTAFFSNGSSQTVSWAATGFHAGAAQGTNWSVSESGDTFSSSWSLTNNTGLSLTRLVLDGTPGKTTFDRTNPNPGTPNSGGGIDFTVISGLGSDDILATYRNVLAIPPNPPVGDEFTLLDLQWTNGTNFGTGRTLGFQQDTDNASSTIEVNVPEPATLLLFGVGIAGVVTGGYRRLRRKPA